MGLNDHDFSIHNISILIYQYINELLFACIFIEASRHNASWDHHSPSYRASKNVNSNPPSPPPPQKKRKKRKKKRIWSMKALAWSMEDPIVKMIDYLSMVKVSKMFIGNIDYIPLYFKNRLFLLFKSNESKLCIYKSFYFHLLNTGSASRVKAPVILEFNLFLSHFSIFLISSWKF